MMLGGAVSAITYTYDNTTNKKTRTDSNGTLTTCTLDPTYQLQNESRTTSSGLGFVNTYVYDKVGNRTQASYSGQVTTLTYSSANRLMSAASAGSLTTYANDAAENLPCGIDTRD